MFFLFFCLYYFTEKSNFNRRVIFAVLLRVLSAFKLFVVLRECLFIK